MRHLPFTRESWIPKGATKVADKMSDAVAYLYTTAAGKPGAAIFFGKQNKPVSKYYYRDAARREAGGARSRSRAGASRSPSRPSSAPSAWPGCPTTRSARSSTPIGATTRPTSNTSK